MEKDAIQKAGPARGLIRPLEQNPTEQNPTEQSPIEHERILPPPSLAHLVRHFWYVSWNLETSVVKENLPHPAIHLVFENGRAEIVGVPTSRFTVELSGKGRVVGVRFHPGAFSSLVAGLNDSDTAGPSEKGRRSGAASDWTDRRLPASDALGPQIEQTLTEVESQAWPECLTPLIRMLEDLSARVGPLPADALLARRLVERLESEAELKRVEQLCDDEGIPMRTLQRLFLRHVGVSPKWVICRFRLHEALARIDAGEPENWAALALDLGYFDQAHFINDFSRFVGSTPAQYRRRPTS